MFIYKPLDSKVDSLRVLVLHPGTANDQVRCDLENRTFASKPVYEALSYTWGLPPASETIEVNGEDFLVRENLYNALRGLRGTEPRYLWCDAICIDQSSIIERNYQVGLMSYIYTRARCVNVWLGLSLDRTLSTSHGIEDELDHRKFMLGSSANSAALINHPYWYRLWVVQEQVLARRLEFYLDATWHMSGDEFYELIDNLEENAHVERIKLIQRQRDLRDTDERRFEQLIDTFQDSQCTQARDGVYGFLGMAHDHDMEVDYSIGYFELYANTLQLHQKSGFLNVEVPEDRFWLDEANDRAARLVMFSQLLQKILHGAVEPDCSQSGATDPPATYRARGALIGKIVHLGPTYAEAVGSAKASRLWKKAIEDNYKGESLRLMRIRDASYTHDIEGWDETNLRILRSVDTRASYGYRWNGDESMLASDAEVSGIDHSEPQRFLATQRVMGFAPPGASVGDWVCGFFGCSVHFLLRKVAPDRWVLVGRADAVIARSGGWNEGSEFEAAVNFDLEQLDPPNLDEELQEDPDSSEEWGMQVMDMIMNIKIDLHTLQQLTCWT